jgi:hypothetical protein
VKVFLGGGFVYTLGEAEENSLLTPGRTDIFSEIILSSEG